MSSKVHHVLESLRLTHALCFESLLGQVSDPNILNIKGLTNHSSCPCSPNKQVRVGRQLPWERGASLCIKEEEVLRFETYVITNANPMSLSSGIQSKTLQQLFLELVCQWPGTQERGDTW